MNTFFSLNGRMVLFMRKYIGTGKLDEVIVIMSEGSQEARQIIETLISGALKDKNNWEVLKMLLQFDEMNIRGEQIVRAYDVFYKKSAEDLLDGIRIHDLNLVSFLNSYPDAKEKATVTAAIRNGFKQVVSANPQNQIYIVDQAWNVAYIIPDKSYLRLIASGAYRDIQLDYLDDYHFMANRRIWEIHEFGVQLLERGLQCYPTDHKEIRHDILYIPPHSAREKKRFLKMLQ